MATFSTLYNEVLAYGFASTYTTRVKAWINEAQSRIARAVEIRELLTTSTVTTVNGTNSYTIPTDLVRIKGIVDAVNGTQLRPLESSEYLFANNMGTQNQSNYAQFYTLGSAGLTLSPGPNAAVTYNLYYYKTPTALSADGDISILPVDYHDLMVSYALSRAYRSEDDVPMSQFYYAEYQRDLSQLKSDRQHELADGPKIVPGTWGNW